MQANLTINTGLKELPFPMRVASRENPEGQWTVAGISVSARVHEEREGEWTHSIIRILHAHRDRIGASTLRTNIMDYLLEMKAEMVRVDFRFPFFYEKRTPVSKEKCLVCYPCVYSAKVSCIGEPPRIFLRAEIPVLVSCSTYSPNQAAPPPVGMSRLVIETESMKDIYPEDLVDIADRNALSPVYSFLTPEDEDYLQTLFRRSQRSIQDAIKGISGELARNPDIGWYSLSCVNSGLLCYYGTEMSADRKMLFPNDLCGPFEG